MKFEKVRESSNADSQSCYNERTTSHNNVSVGVRFLRFCPQGQLNKMYIWSVLQRRSVACDSICSAIIGLEETVRFSTPTEN